MSNMTARFLTLRKKKRMIREFLRDENSKNIIKDNIDNRCLKLISINNNSLILKANKKLRDCDDEMFMNVIYLFLINIFKKCDINVDKISLSLITEINYNKDDYRIIIEI